jgi:voltage-gated potassium channel
LPIAAGVVPIQAGKARGAMGESEEGRLHRSVRLLYSGRSKQAVRFRYGLIVFDVATIIYFIATATVPLTPALIALNTGLGLLILADFSARLLIAPDKMKLLRQIYVLADLVVILALLFEPFLAQNLAMLRVLRGLRFLHSYHLMRDLRRDNAFFRNHEDAVLAAVNLFVFVFVTTSVVYVLEFGAAAGPAGYIDALYFTVATLTTTGFGDITLGDPLGKLLSVFIMIVGVALFVRLAKAIFQPARVRHRCPDCGLSRHERDAIHCKHCGRELAIETEGIEE